MEGFKDTVVKKILKNKYSYVQNTSLQTCTEKWHRQKRFRLSTTANAVLLTITVAHNIYNVVTCRLLSKHQPNRQQIFTIYQRPNTELFFIAETIRIKDSKIKIYHMYDRQMIIKALIMYCLLQSRATDLNYMFLTRFCYMNLLSFFVDKNEWGNILHHSHATAIKLITQLTHCERPGNISTMESTKMTVNLQPIYAIQPINLILSHMHKKT